MRAAPAVPDGRGRRVAQMADNLIWDGGCFMDLDTAVTTNPNSDDTPIWRYMDLSRFVAVLATRSLWFSKIAGLRDDPYEGFCRAACIRLSAAEDVGPKWVTHTDPEGTAQISAAEMIARFTRLAAGDCENAPEHLYVNSWCLAEESMAMWQIYGLRGTGVAVKSSVDRYQRAAKFDVRPEQYTLGPVSYHADITSCAALQYDFTRGAVPLPGPSLWARILGVGFHKRACYEYEREWRSALYQDSQPSVTGCAIPFDLDALIEEVYVGPRAEAFLPEVVESIMGRFDLNKPLKVSSLLRPPQNGVPESEGRDGPEIHPAA